MRVSLWIAVGLFLPLSFSVGMAEETILRDDVSVIVHSGNLFWRANAARTPLAYENVLADRRMAWIGHYICPENHQDAEALVLSGLYGQQLIAPCANTDSVQFLAQITFATSRSRIDSVEDFRSLPYASATLYMSREGVTSRLVYSSLNRPQSTEVDVFIDFLRYSLIAGQAFVIRLCPVDGSGVMFLCQHNEVQLRFTTDEDAEPFADVGTGGIQYLSTQVLPPFHGVVLRGLWEGFYGQDHFLTVRGLSPTGATVLERAILLPGSGAATAGSFTLGIPLETLADHPSLTFVCNPDGEGYSCYGDSLSAWFAP